MKKNTKSQTALLKLSDCPAGSTVGLDIGDRWIHAAVLGSDGELLLEDRIESQEPAVRRWLTKLSGGVVAMEVGTHSRWMAKVGVECGHEVLVANPRAAAIDLRRRQQARPAGCAEAGAASTVRSDTLESGAAPTRNRSKRTWR